MGQLRENEVGHWGKRAPVVVIIGWCVQEWASSSRGSVLPIVVIQVSIVLWVVFLEPRQEFCVYGNRPAVELNFGVIALP